MRAGTALAAVSMLAGCGVVGPSQTELQGAVRDFYAHPGGVAISADTRRLQNHDMIELDGCQPNNGVFTCLAAFETDDGAVFANLWAERKPEGGWRVRNIAVQEESR